MDSSRLVGALTKFLAGDPHGQEVYPLREAVRDWRANATEAEMFEERTRELTGVDGYCSDLLVREELA